MTLILVGDYRNVGVFAFPQVINFSFLNVTVCPDVQPAMHALPPSNNGLQHLS